MKKNFLLLLLLTLLPLAGWAQTEIDVTVTPYDGQAEWCGGAPIVQKNWVIVSAAVTVPADVKTEIAKKLVAQTLDGKYGAGEHTYKLALKNFNDATVSDGGNDYVIHTSGSNTAILTITKYTGIPAIADGELAYVNDYLEYTGSAQALLGGGATAKANNVNVPVIYTLNPDGNPLVTFDSYANVKGTNAGDYTVYYKVADTDDYAGTDWTSMGTKKNIAKADLDWSDQNVTPTAGSWIYDGEPHARAIAPANPYDFATYQYALTNSGEDQDWSTEIPTGTNYNERIVWWRVLESDNYKAKAPAQLTATFTKGTPVFTTAPTFAESRPYNGEELHQIVSVGETTLGAQPVFRRRTKGGNGQWGAWSDWKSDLGYFTRTAAGECQLQYTTRTTDNLNPAIAGPSYSDPVDVVISKADITTDDFTAPTAAALTYDGTDQALVEGAATTGIDGTFTYATSEDGETWSDFDAAVPTGKNAKPYYVKYKFTPTANYNAYEAVVENVAIAPLSIVDGEGNLATGFALSAANMEAANASVYTGTAIKPTVALRYKGESMTHSVLAGGDYARSYNNNINASNEAEIIFTAKNNFTGAYTQKFTINKADIANLNVTLAQDTYDYSAAANEPGVTVKLGQYTFAAEDYAVEYTNNTNAGTATVTVTPNVENFTAASTSVNFTINKAPLTVKVADAEKAYGSVDPTPAVESIDGFVGGQTAAVLPEGAYSINRADGADPNTYAYNVVDNDVVGCNYSFVNASPQGALIIKAATVIVRATAVNDTYGDYYVPALDQSGFAFTAEGLKAGHIIDALTFTVKDAEDNVYDAGDMLPAGTYTITPSEAHTDAGSYTFDYQTATLTIAKRNLTLTAVDQIIEYGNSANTSVAFEGVDKTVDVVNRVGADDLGTITINVAAEATSIDTHVDAITLSVEGENANYNYTLVPGDLTITAPVAGITLDGSASIAQVISDYNGKKVNVKIDFSSRNGRDLGGDRSWKQFDWMTLTLPFDISVADLSKKLGYAIVNVIDPTRTVVSGTTSKFYGKLTMTGGNGNDDVLVANKPFLVKTADDINGVIDFGLQTIVAPASAEDLTVNAGQGATFVGAYAPYTVTSADEAKKWFMIGGGNGTWAYIGTTSGNSWQLQSTEAYLQLPIETPSIIFNFEDVDGGTTAIKSVNADDLAGKKSAEGWYTINGVKLQNAPAEKGVYIKDGKKVVLK